MAELSAVQVLEGHTDRVWNVAWSPDGKPAKLYGNCHGLQLASGHKVSAYAGNSIASCSGDKTVRVWQKQGQSDTWICSAILEETHHRSIRCSSWSPDGRYLATASFDATTAIWEVQVSRLLALKI